MKENKDSQEIRTLKKTSQQSRNVLETTNLEIHGISQSANENLLSKLNDLAETLELPVLTERDVEGLNRLPAKTGKVPAVLVRFVSRITRYLWLEKWHYQKETRSNISFLDQLSATKKKLLWLLKGKAEEKQYPFAWQKSGNLFARKKIGDRVIKIECHADLDKIV